MEIIAIANFKGGTGKTVTACNLAAILAREGKNVLLIDADPQHNSTDFFCPDLEEAFTLTDVLEGKAETVWSNNLTPTEFDGLELLPADMGLLRLDLAAILSGADAYDARLFGFLEAARADGELDYVLIDCPPSFTAASVAALVCCDAVILPTRADAFSRTGTLELIAQVKSLGRFSVSPCFRVLVTAADRTRLSRQAVEQLRLDGLDLFDTVIRRSVTVGESSYACVPLYAYAPGSPAAQDYEALAREILETDCQPVSHDGEEARADGQKV